MVAVPPANWWPLAGEVRENAPGATQSTLNDHTPPESVVEPHSFFATIFQ